MAQTVLIADDSIASQRLFEMVLTREGYDVITVGSGADVLDRVKAKQPDLALIDALMPGVDGYQICQALRKDPKFKDLPLIMLAGTYEEVDREKGAKIVGAKAILEKPSKSNVIVSKVKEILALQEQLQRERQKPKIAPPPPAAGTKEAQRPRTEGFAEVVQEPPFVEKEYEFDDDSEEVDLVVESEILDEEAEWEEGEEEQETFPTVDYEEEPAEEVFEEPVIEESFAEEELVVEEPLAAEELVPEEPVAEAEPILEEPVAAAEPASSPMSSVMEIAATDVKAQPMRSGLSAEQFTLSEENLDVIAEKIAFRLAGKLVPALMQSIARYVLEIPAVKQIVEHASQNLMKEILPELKNKLK